MFTSFLTAIIAGYIGLVGIVYIGQRSLMYHPGGPIGPPEAYGVQEMSELPLETDAGQVLISWYAPPKPDQPILVFFHGNAGTIGDRAQKVRPYLSAGFGVILAGYRGFGGNPGSPSETGLYDDAATILNHLKATGISSERWVLYGESLGSGVATEMAHRYAISGMPIGALVLEAPFSSMGDAAAIHYPYIPTRFLVHDKYDSIAKIDAINTPLMIVHGAADRTVPLKLGRRLFEAAKQPKFSLWLEKAGHNDLYDFGAATHIIKFLRLIFKER